MTTSNSVSEAIAALALIGERSLARGIIYYHADLDGCTSAALWTEILSARLKDGLDLRKVFTSGLGFESVTAELANAQNAFVLFLDLPAGTQFTRWSTNSSSNVLIAVYDHHDVGEIRLPDKRFVQFGLPRTGDLPPTCVFSAEVFEAITGKDAPRWLTTIGLAGEGLTKTFKERVCDWPAKSHLVKLLSRVILQRYPDGHKALDYLRRYLLENRFPLAPLEDPQAQGLLAIAREIDEEIRAAVGEVVAAEPKPVISHLLRSNHEIANYVASDVLRQRKQSVVLIGEIVKSNLIRAELRVSRQDPRDLREWARIGKNRGILLGGGGHPSAIGARLATEKWPELVKLVEGLAA
jgi:single-stranded DNA-specific DHH superfamily exonuclease